MHTSEEMEHVVRLIPGVLQVRIVCSDDTITEIHVLAGADRHTKQIVRDIESTLMAHLGQRVDRRVISVAQLRDAEDEPKRIQLDSVQLTLRSDVTDVRVEVLFGDQRYVGTSSGATTRRQRARAVAEATLAAVEASLDNTVHFFLDDIVIAPMDEDEAIISTVGVEENDNEEILVGCAFVRRDEAKAAARAALAAINRRYGLLKSQVDSA